MALDPIVNGDTVTFTGPNQTVSDDLGYGLFYTSGFDATYSGTLTQGFTKFGEGRLLLTGILDFPHDRYERQMVIDGGVVAASAEVWGNHGIMLFNGGTIEITGGLFTTEVNGFDTGGLLEDGNILVTGLVTIDSAVGQTPFYGTIFVRNGGDLTLTRPRFTFNSRGVEIDGTSTLSFGPTNYVLPIRVADGATLYTDVTRVSGDDVAGGIWNKAGTGELRLTGFGNQRSAGVNVNSGRLFATYANLPLSVYLAPGTELELGDTIFPGQSNDGTLTSVIIGSGSVVKSGTGILILTGDHTYMGGTTISGGTLRIGDGSTRGSIGGDIVNDETLVFDRSDALRFAGAISGSGTLIKDGAGTLELSGVSDFSGDTEILSGGLIVNGELSQSYILVGDGTLLGGNGAVHSFAVSPGGRVSPSNSVGTLNVLGDAYFEAGSFFDVEIEGDRSDFLQVAGEAGLEGGTINVLGAAGGVSSQRYTILTAANGVTGQFDTVIDDIPDIDFADVYDGTSVSLVARQAAGGSSVSSKANGVAATAGVIDTASTFTSLLGGRMAGGAQPGTTVAPLFYAGTTRSEAMEAIDQAAQSEGMAASSLSVFLHGMGETRSVSAQGSASGYDTTMGGLLGGIEYADLVSNAVFGIAGGSSVSQVSVTDGSARTTGGHLGVYGGYELGNLTLTGALAYHWGAVDLSRTIAFGGGGGVVASGSTSMQAVTGSAEAFYDVGRLADLGWSIGPVASLQGVSARREGYTETGAGILNLDVGADSVTRLDGTIGVRLGGQFDMGDMIVKPQAELRYDRQLGNSTTIGQAAIPLAGASFDPQIAAAAQQQLGVGLSLGVEFTPSFSVKASYDGSFGHGTQSHRGLASMSVKF